MFTVLAWIHSPDEDDDDLDPNKRLLPRTPTSIRPASHNHVPTPKPNAVPGRHFDHERQADPVTITRPVGEVAPVWRTFMNGTGYPSATNDPEIVGEDWLKEHLPDLDSPWKPEESGTDAEESGLWLLNPSRRRRKLHRLHVRIRYLAV